MTTSSQSRPLAVVTGASRGIGAIVATALAREGYAVCVNYMENAEAAEKVVAQIGKSGGVAWAVQANVAEPDQVARMFHTVDDTPGQLRVLVNNAGHTGGRKDFTDITIEDLHTSLGVNLLGAIYCAQEATRRMARSRGGDGGSIVNVVSQAGVSGGNRLLPYAVAKAGLAVMTVGLARELAGEGIRVNAASPGVIATDMAASDHVDMDHIKQTIPMGRIGTPQEVADTVMWLVSEKASYIAGAVVPVTGGR